MIFEDILHTIEENGLEVKRADMTEMCVHLADDLVLIIQTNERQWLTKVCDISGVLPTDLIWPLDTVAQTDVDVHGMANDINGKHMRPNCRWMPLEEMAVLVRRMKESYDVV